MSDIFNKPAITTARPVTADMIQLLWGATGSGGTAILQANNFQAQYQQAVSQRYTLNSPQNYATIYPGRPKGNITIGRLICDNEQNIFTLAGFDVCQPPAVITWANTNSNTTASCNLALGTYIARGAWVTSYGFQADADNLMVLDNVTIEFLQLEFDPGTAS
jgi:hypothetical protein